MKEQSLITQQHPTWGYSTLGLGAWMPTQGQEKGVESVLTSTPTWATARWNLLGVFRQESMADSCCHTQRHFQDM